jgi:hypothetical protein
VTARLLVFPHENRSPGDELPPQDRARMFRLGMIEALPLVAGGVFATFSTTWLDGLFCAAGAIPLSLLLCWCLRHQTPDTRIEIAATPSRAEAAHEQRDHATPA